MASMPATWAIHLRCQNCRRLFTVKGIPPARIAAVADDTHCPHCSYPPENVSLFGKRNLIESLEREKSDA